MLTWWTAWLQKGIECVTGVSSARACFFLPKTDSGLQISTILGECVRTWFTMVQITSFCLKKFSIKNTDTNVIC